MLVGKSQFITALIVWAMIQPAHAEPLEPLLDGLLDSHPQVAAQKQAIASSKQSEKEAFSGFLPKIDASAGMGFESIDRTETNPGGNQTNYPTENYSLNVTQNVFDGFRSTSTTDIAELGTAAAEETYRQTIQQILFEGVSSYLEVLRQIELTELALENQKTLKKQLHLEDERVQRGSGIAVDVLQAKSRLQISMERYTAFMGALKDAISRYTQVFNKEPNMETMMVPAIPFGLIPATLEEAIEKARQANPSLKANEYSVNIAETARTTAKSGYFPSVDVVGATSYDDNLSGTSGEETKYSMQVKATWSLFSGFADKARYEKSGHDYQAALQSYHYAERKVIEEVKLAWSSLTTSRDRLELLENAVNIAGEVYDARKRLRDAGSETALNVLDAENELFRAKIDAASAKFDYYIAVYRLMNAMGQLTVESATEHTVANGSPITDGQSS